MRQQESYTNEIDILRNEYQNAVEQAQGHLVQSNTNAEMLHARLSEVEHQEVVQSEMLSNTEYHGMNIGNQLQITSEQNRELVA